MAYQVYLWDPEVDKAHFDFVEAFLEGGPSVRPWSCGRSLSLKPEDIAILRRTRSEPRGIVGIGVVVRGSYEGKWDDGTAARFVEVDWEILDTEPFVTEDDVPDGGTLWSAQAGGTSLDPVVGQAVVERAWELVEWSFVPSAEEFAANWRANPPTDVRWRMLVTHYWSSETDMHPEFMARQMGWPNGGSSHLHYGGFAGVTAEQMGVEMVRSDKVALFASIHRVDGSLRWRMHDEVKDAIRMLGWHQEGGPALTDDEEERVRFAEGQASRRTIMRRERHASVRTFCLETHGTACTACSFDPRAEFGEQFTGLIEIHHLDPIAASDPGRETDPSTDCVPLCPVCHRLAHLGMRAGTCRTIDEVKALRDRGASRAAP